RAVEDPGLAEDALLGEAGNVLRDVAHGVERVRDDDEDGVGRLRHYLLGDRLDDALVRRYEVVPAHPGRARLAGRDHHDVGAGGLLVAVRPHDGRLVAQDRPRLVDVERLALREVLDDVDEDDVRVVAAGDLLCRGRAHGTGADDGDLAAPLAVGRGGGAANLGHTVTPSLSMIASATSLVPTAVGSSRVGFMS